MKKYNLKQLVSVEVIDKIEMKEYRYLPFKESELSIGGITLNQEEGIYKISHGGFTLEFICSEYSNDTFFDDHIIGDNKVIYLKPRIAFGFSNGEYTAIYFNSFREAVQYFVEVDFDKFKWLIFNNGEVHQTN